MKSMREKGRANIPLLIAVMLACGILLSMYFTSGVLARYTSEGSSTNAARVAVFNTSLERKAEESGADLSYIYPVALSSGDDANSYTLVVQNNSEVAVRYTVELRFTDSVPEYITVNGVAGDGSSSVIALDGGDLDPNSGEVEYPIEIEVDLEKFTENADGLSASAELDFDAFVKFVQID